MFKASDPISDEEYEEFRRENIGIAFTLPNEKTPYMNHRFSSPKTLPKPEQRIIAVIDTVATCDKYPGSIERYKSREPEIISMVHYYDGDYYDDELDKVVILGWRHVVIIPERRW